MRSATATRPVCAAAGILFALALLAGLGRIEGRALAAGDAVSPSPHGSTHHPASDALDTRTPLRLLPTMAEHQKRNMRDHLAAVQEIVAGLAADDMPAVAGAARRIGYSDSMAQTCEHMGAATPGFTEMAIEFHRTADTIFSAAERGDAKAAAEALAATVGTCVRCHATYRQEVVDEETWRRLSARETGSR